MITHIIYHAILPNGHKKIGCTRNLENRSGWYPKGTVIEILEELHDKTDQEAGDREWWWADKFGYKRENHYTVIAKVFGTPERFSRMGRKGGLISGRKQADLGITPFQLMSSEQQSKFGRIGGPKAQELGLGIHGMSYERRAELGRQVGLTGKGGIARMAALSPEERSEVARQAAMSPSPDKRSANARKAGLKGGLSGGFSKMGECPHCGKKTNMANLYQWHLDRCKKKEGNK